MVQIWKITKRHVDAKKGEELPQILEQIKIFSTYIGHGVGTVDFSEKIAEISLDEYSKIIQNSDEYANFKLANLMKFYEIEIHPEHAKRLVKSMPECLLKDILKGIKDTYLVLRLVP